MAKTLISNCCGAQPFFELGFAHGVYLDDDGHYQGSCGKCKKHAYFAQVLDSSGPKYEQPKEIKDAGTKSDQKNP